MATKTKTAGSTHSAPETNLEGMFSEALDLVNQKHYDKAIAALEAVQVEAGKHGMIAMARSARNYVTALQARTPKAEETHTDAALELLDKALQTQSQDARLFYLKATAHAQKDEAEAAAEAVRQAVALNQDFLHQFRLERDFDRIRSSASFVALDLE